MIGKKMLLYDKANDMFFAGYKARRGRGAEMTPTWCKSIAEAIVVDKVDVAYRYKEQLGLGVRIVTEEEASEIRGA